MSKKFWGLAGISVIGAAALFHFATLPPSPPTVPPVPENIATPNIPALTVYDMPTGQVEVSDEPYRATFRSVGIPDLVERDLATGVYKGTPVYDLDYAEDSNAETDMNVVMTETGGLIEIQATAENGAFSHEELLAMLSLAKGGINELVAAQKKALNVE